MEGGGQALLGQARQERAAGGREDGPVDDGVDVARARVDGRAPVGDGLDHVVREHEPDAVRLPQAAVDLVELEARDGAHRVAVEAEVRNHVHAPEERGLEVLRERLVDELPQLVQPGRLLGHRRLLDERAANVRGTEDD